MELKLRNSGSGNFDNIKNNMGSNILKELGVKGGKLVEYHRGYAANSYLLLADGKKYFVKEFRMHKLKDVIKNYNLNYGKSITAEEYKKSHISLIKKLNSIKNGFVMTPLLVKSKGDILMQEYVAGTEFYRYLSRECSMFHTGKNLKKIFYEAGVFLAELHNRNFKRYDSKKRPVSDIHGDLNSKNILFTKNKMVILDPGIVSGNIYRDIGRFILNLYPANMFYSFIISSSGLKNLRRAFLEGYKKTSRFKIDYSDIKYEMISILKKEKIHLSKKTIYKIKKLIIDRHTNYMISRIKDGKIQL